MKDIEVVDSCFQTTVANADEDPGEIWNSMVTNSHAVGGPKKHISFGFLTLWPTSTSSIRRRILILTLSIPRVSLHLFEQYFLLYMTPSPKAEK
jgi:hypothetical protein